MSNTNIDPDLQYMKVLNKYQYLFKIRVHNPDGDEQIFDPLTVVHMVIEDELHFWPVRGFFMIENPYEIMERKMVSTETITNHTTLAVDETDNVNKKAYVFRNDGRDFVDITISRISDTSSDSRATEITIPPEIWEINLKCVIYDQEDIESNEISTKRKKYYFWDADYQKMLDSHVQWSTATSLYNETLRKNGPKYIPSQATDEERKMFTGDAVKALLTENGFAVDASLFDKGSTKLFYSAYHDCNMWDNIEYLLNQHMSEKTGNNQPVDISDICIFDKDRYTQKFELMPVHKIFEKAGNQPDVPKEYQLENMLFDENYGDEGTGSISSRKAPSLKTISTTKGMHLTKITKYKYVDTCAADNTCELVTTPVHSYNFKDKTFSISTADSNVLKLEEKLKKIYIENKFLTKNGAHPLLTLNQNKIANKVVNLRYSPRWDKQAIICAGLGRLLYSSLFLNQCLVLTVDGETIRRPGRFIGVDRGGFSDNTFDYKLCGQWFVTGVKHIFLGDLYSNECTCVKMHSYDTLNISQKVQ